MKFLIKIIPSIASWVTFIYVVLQVPYPESITQANITQLLSFFIPLFLAATLTLNIFLKNIFISTSLSLGLIFLLILKALYSLNLVTGILTAVAIGLLVSYFRKMKRSNLTKWPKIPRLTRLRKENR